ncbi:DUF1616 domain-containing protein [bacterium]|nr:DUF1616 domain-containing protein [bacterium]
MNEILTTIVQVIRVPIAICLIGYLPGAALMGCLFPPKKLNRAEHFYLSTLSSLCLTALTAYALARLADGMTPMRLGLWLSGFTLLFWAGWMGRAFLNAPARPEDRGVLAQIGHGGAGQLTIQQGAIQKLWQAVSVHLPAHVVGGGLLLIILGGAVFTSYNNPAGHGLTEFYLSPANYEATGIEYAQRDNLLVLPVEVINREDQPRTYRFEAHLDGVALSLPIYPTLEDKERWAGDLEIPLPVGEAVARLDLLLFDITGIATDNSQESAEGSTQLSREPDANTKEHVPVAQLRFWLQDESMQQRESRQP